MTNINFMLIGKIKDDNLLKIIKEFKTKLSKYASVSVSFIDDSKVIDETNQTLISKALDTEAQRVLKLIKEKDFLITLDLRGKEMDSISFASKFNDIVSYNSQVVILVGSSYGLSDKIRDRSNLLLKLSNMTFTHPITLMLIMEQVFRSYKINKNETYHK